MGQRQGVRAFRQENRQEIRQVLMTLHRFETVLELARLHALQNGRVRVARFCADLATVVDLPAGPTGFSPRFGGSRRVSQYGHPTYRCEYLTNNPETST